ncbi:hypothetical protein HY636_03495 [Candidatus Woesearchaeota archaeon]|nr:hypothetical protein [Candidatus Woesearchaeota archaeon]
MCFSPHVSISVAIIEFVLATLILLLFRKSFISKFMALFIYLLGFYQFTEFMVCISANPDIWAKLGFITYTFLPAIGLHFILRISTFKFNKKLNKKLSTTQIILLYLLLYTPPVLFSLFSIFTPNFIVETSCNTIFVTIKNLLFNTDNYIKFTFYWLYYFGFITIATIISLIKYHLEKNKYVKLFYLLGALGLLIITIPPLILIVIFPALNVMYPSIYCKFALLFAVIAFILCYLSSVHKIPKMK